ncbi:hypothetical protein IEO21_05460 [Rhodonia placenta]|uniref:Uncharacterized protein n=1 Tax=Rhodonia placenta TaxID=104341 RepID=A0A8H7U1L1_9APHY|nr:hypothetical protein IEO21_05460 [Postia placenta]
MITWCQWMTHLRNCDPSSLKNFFSHPWTLSTVSVSSNIICLGGGPCTKSSGPPQITASSLSYRQTLRRRCRTVHAQHLHTLPFCPGRN